MDKGGTREGNAIRVALFNRFKCHELLATSITKSNYIHEENYSVRLHMYISVRFVISWSEVVLD